MAVDVLGLNDTYVSQLREAIAEGAAGLSDVPMLLKCVLRDGCWRERRIRTGDPVTFERFEEFVATKPLEGLGTDMDLIKRICSADTEAVELLDRALGSHQGERVDLVSNGNEVEERPVGNMKRRALRKLREDRPDLHAKVIAGEVSPHAAMLEAGFRKPTVTLPLEPAAAMRLIVKHFSRDAVEALLASLANWCGKDLVDKPE